MNENRQMEVHYSDNGFPYTANESFMDFFDGLTHAPATYPHAMSMQDQENAYWSMNMNSYKFGFSDPGSTSYYSPYGVNDCLPRMDVSRTPWEYPSIMTADEPTTTNTQFEEDVVEDVPTIPGETSPSYHSSNSPQDVWQEQDDIDPDSMTYEELLDLGETVGTESKGLSPELISLLPISKCKVGSFFSRKKSGERCVICQTRYKRGDKQINLLCKHVYHSQCITKWLSINKVCPVCNNEVFGEESKHQ